MIPMHIGSDHPAAAALTILLAFGPFLVLGLAIVVTRRRDGEETGSASGRSEDQAR